MFGQLANHMDSWQQLAQCVRERFPQLSYVDVILAGQTKSAWALPLDAQSAETGTLAECLTRLGATVKDDLTLDDIDHGDSDSDSKQNESDTGSDTDNESSTGSEDSRGF